ncbi:hypothetical protein JCM6882_006492 [Rhodosporidiobolus microsporus]
MRFSLASLVVLALGSSAAGALAAAVPSTELNTHASRGVDVGRRDQVEQVSHCPVPPSHRAAAAFPPHDDVGCAYAGRGRRRGVCIDLGGVGVGVKRSNRKVVDLAKRQDELLAGLNPLVQGLGLSQNAVTGLIAELNPVLSALGLGDVGDALSDSEISVSAANDDGLANVTIIGAGALEGVTVTLPTAASTGAIAGAPQVSKAE